MEMGSSLSAACDEVMRGSSPGDETPRVRNAQERAGGSDALVATPDFRHCRPTSLPVASLRRTGNHSRQPGVYRCLVISSH